MKPFIEMIVSSYSKVEKAVIQSRTIDERRGISVELDSSSGRILQYKFAFEKGWSFPDAVKYLKDEQTIKPVAQSLDCAFSGPVTQASFLPADKIEALKQAGDPNPMDGLRTVRIKYGIGSNKQKFGQGFFEKVGQKFEGKNFLLNHSDLTEFGNARPIGSIVKFLGATAEGADFAVYISSSEGGIRQKMKEAIALGKSWDGFGKVSIEGLPVRSDYTVGSDGVKDFHDLAYPIGIALVQLEGMAGSRITS